MMFTTNRRANRPAERVDHGSGRAWEYLSPDSEPVAGLAAEAVSAGRHGYPDPIRGTAAPEVFARSNATFAQLAQSARKQAADECAEDVAFLVDRAVEFVAARRLSPAAGSEVDREHAARLQAEFSARLSRLGTREERHRAELGELQPAAEATTALLTHAWQSKHPHPDHLGHFRIPVFEMPADAGDIGQVAVERALRRATDLTEHTHNPDKE